MEVNMELREFFGLIRNEDVQEIIVRAKDCVYRWEEGKAFIAPFNETHSSDSETITYDNGTPIDYRTYTIE
jgi:hypothetical protein